MLTRFDLKLGNTASNKEKQDSCLEMNHKYNEQYKIRLSA